MSQELLYTSAPAGLNPSDQGFCTVACTEGLPRNLKEVLENLSGYRQADQPPHPVNHSHLIHTVGGKRYQILSRVSDYEKDYSGRTNKLAHHVALTVDELPASGPAALLSNSVCQSTWDGETRWIQGGPVLPVASAYQGPCRRWESLVGDAGWAGILAESAADGSNRPMYVIFPQGEEMLPLVSEALGVLPPGKAWTTSFSTYFTKLPAGVDCLWRFVLDGSPEAQAARSASHGRVIDLVELQRNRRRAPDGNPYVQAARAGKVMDAPPMAAAGTFAASATTAMPTAPSPAESTVPESPFTVAAKAPASPFGPSRRQEQLSSKMVMAIAGIAVVLFVGVGTLVYSMLTRDIPKPIDPESLAQDDRERPIQKKTNKEFLSPQEKARREAAKKTQKKTQVKLVAPPPMEVVKNHIPAPMPKDEIKGPWERTLRSLNGNLPLPEKKPKQDVFTKPEPTKLAEIHTLEPGKIDLVIHSISGNSEEIGQENSTKEGFLFEVEDEENDEGLKTRRWVVVRRIIGDSDGLERLVPIGTFELSDQVFTFHWNLDAQDWASPSSLQFCLLEIREGKASHRFRLSGPKIVKPEPYDLAGRNQELYLAIKSSAVENPEALRLDLELLGVGSQPNSKNGLKVGDTVTFKVEGKPLEFDLTFKYDKKGKGPHVKVEPIWNREILVSPLPKRNPNQPAEEIDTALLRRFRDPAEKMPIEQQRLKTNLPDLARIRAAAERNAGLLASSPRLKKIKEVEIPGKTRELKDLQGELKKARENGEPTTNIENQIRATESQKENLVEIVNEYRKRIGLLESHVESANDLEPLLVEIGKTARLAYSIYMVVDGEKIELVRADAATPETQNKPQP